jgi:hypothetical protein
LLNKVVAAIISSGKSLAQASNESKDGGPVNPPLMFKWHGKKYLGAAHGLCGILCILIQVRYYFLNIYMLKCKLNRYMSFVHLYFYKRSKSLQNKK